MSQSSLKRIKVTKQISMKIPSTFAPIFEADLNGQSEAARQPIALYASQDQQVNLGINENSSLFAASDYEILKDFQKSNILNLFDQVDFIQEDILEIGSRKYVVYEFVSKVTDEQSTFGGRNSTSKYNYIMYTLINNRLLFFNFNCPARMKSNWEDAAQEVMESIRIKE